MSKHPRALFTYSHILPRKAPIPFVMEMRVKVCPRCGQQFQTQSRQKFRCDACQKVMKEILAKQSQKRFADRRRKRTAKLLKNKEQ